MAERSEWEYALFRWSFAGPLEDEWPEQQQYRAEYERASREGPRISPVGIHNPHADPAVMELRERYRAWRHEAEKAPLNAFGRAGFEMIGFERDERGQFHAAFKRPITEGQIPAPTFPQSDLMN